MNRFPIKGTKETQVTKGTKGTQGRVLPEIVQGFIPPHGGYEELLSYQKSLVVFDATMRFCARFFAHDKRTTDQMVQGARSGKQNIVEGSEASGTSKEMEIKLTKVARASQQELLEDYRDFMRNRGIKEWPREHRYARRLSQLSRTPGANYETFKKAVEHPDPAICSNAIAGLIKLTRVRQFIRIAKKVSEGGAFFARCSSEGSVARGAM